MLYRRLSDQNDVNLLLLLPANVMPQHFSSGRGILITMSEGFGSTATPLWTMAMLHYRELVEVQAPLHMV